MILVTTAPQRLTGTYGYVATFNLTDYLPQTVSQVQVYNGTTLSAVSQTSTPPSTLDTYCGLVTCPTFAWTQKGNHVDVFLKTATYPYTATTEVEFTFLRNAQTLTADTDYLDIPDSARELFKNLCWKMMYNAKNSKVTSLIEENIKRQKSFLGLT
jgi:hypothetical protein